MGVTNSNKELSVSSIHCSDSFKVKLSLTAEPNIITNPTDIVLALDRSGSMSGSPFANLKTVRRSSLISLLNLPAEHRMARSALAARSEL